MLAQPCTKFDSLVDRLNELANHPEHITDIVIMSLKKEAEKILIGLHEGKLFYECLEKDIYPQELVLLVKDGEEYQTLATNIDNYNAFLKQNKEQSK